MNEGEPVKFPLTADYARRGLEEPSDQVSPRMLLEGALKLMYVHCDPNTTLSGDAGARGDVLRRLAVELEGIAGVKAVRKVLNRVKIRVGVLDGLVGDNWRLVNSRYRGPGTGRGRRLTLEGIERKKQRIRGEARKILDKLDPIFVMRLDVRGTIAFLEGRKVEEQSSEDGHATKENPPT